MTAFLAAASLVLLTPSEAAARKVETGVLDRFNFAEKAPSLEAFAPVNELDAVLADSLRRMGVKLYRRVSRDDWDTPEFFRARAGFESALQEWDGVIAEAGDEPWRTARAEAETDAAGVTRLRELARRAMKAGDFAVAAEGRRAIIWLAFRNAFAQSPDLLRFEVAAWVRRLESVLGLEASPAPKKAAAVAPQARDPRDAVGKFVTVQADVLSTKELSLDGPKTNALFECDVNGWRLRLTDLGPTNTVTFYFPGPRPGTWRRYDTRLAFGSVRELPPEAPFPERGLLNGYEPRLGGDRPHVWTTAAHHVASFEDPVPRFGFGWDKRKDDRGGYAISNGWGDGWFGRVPGTRPGVDDCWYVAVNAETKYSFVACIQWRGRPEVLARAPFADPKSPPKDAFAKHAESLGYTYRAADADWDFAFAKPGDGSFNAWNREADIEFWERYCRPFTEATVTWERYRTLARDLATARLEYLETKFAGGKLKDPPREKKAEPAKDALERSGELIELDEE